MSTAEQLKPPEPQFKPLTKLVAAYFVESVPFGGETHSVNVGRNADSIAPARLEKDGAAMPVESGQRADGIVLRRKSHNRASNERVVLQAFVPWSNIRALEYGA